MIGADFGHIRDLFDCKIFCFTREAELFGNR